MAPMLELGVFKTLDLSGDEFAQPIEVFARRCHVWTGAR
jgi:hypothetical protein